MAELAAVFFGISALSGFFFARPDATGDVALDTGGTLIESYMDHFFLHARIQLA